MEAGCAIIGATAAILVPDLVGATWAVFAWSLLTLAVFDWRFLWLPDRLTLPLVALGFLQGVLDPSVSMLDRTVGAGAGFASLAAIAALYWLWRGREGLGLGDAKLLAGIGAWLGWRPLPLVVLCASLAGFGLVGGWKTSGRRIDATTALPLGTLLCASVLPGWLAAQWLQLA